MFAKKYIKSVNSSDLRDDPHHHSTDALAAAGLADKGSGGVLGSLLCRVKYSDGAIHKDYESGSGNLAKLLREWTEVVSERGKSRGWLPANTAWDMQAAFTFYERVARASLAHWMDPRCEPCNGAGVMDTRRTCTCCAGSGRAQIEAGRLETAKTLDMVSELEGIFQAHSGRAAAMLRRAA